MSIYGNSLLLNEKFSFRIKSRKDIHKMKFDSRMKSEIEKIAKNIVAKYNQDSKIKEKLKEEKASKLICERDKENKDYDIYFIICDDNQDIRIKLSDIVQNIAKDIEKEINNSKFIEQFSDRNHEELSFYVHNGDGDEGCVYISIQ